MSFDMAMMELRKGKKIHRTSWNGKTQYIILARMVKCVLSDGTELDDPENQYIGSNFIMFVGSVGYQCGWLASQGDMLADDWEIMEV